MPTTCTTRLGSFNLFFTTRRGVVETETLRLGVMSALFFLAGCKAADIEALCHERSPCWL